jgi:hypothetical protein
MYMFAYLLSVLFNDIKVPFTLRRSCDWNKISVSRIDGMSYKSIFSKICRN